MFRVACKTAIWFPGVDLKLHSLHSSVPEIYVAASRVDVTCSPILMKVYYAVAVFQEFAKIPHLYALGQDHGLTEVTKWSEFMIVR